MISAAMAHAVARPKRFRRGEESDRHRPASRSTCAKTRPCFERSKAKSGRCFMLSAFEVCRSDRPRSAALSAEAIAAKHRSAGCWFEWHGCVRTAARANGFMGFTFGVTTAAAISTTTAAASAPTLRFSFFATRAASFRFVGKPAFGITRLVVCGVNKTFSAIVTCDGLVFKTHGGLPTALLTIMPEARFLERPSRVDL